MAAKNKYSIAIVGGGIAGPLLALTILSNKELSKIYDPTVYDQVSSPDDPDEAGSSTHQQYAAGAAVALSSNALYPLLQLGLKEELNEISKETTAICMWRAYGFDDEEGKNHKLLNSVVNPGYKTDIGSCIRVVERKLLQSLFLQKLKLLGGKFEWNKKVVSISATDNGKPVLHFEDGSSVETDLLVGADGSWSNTRKYILQQRGLPDIDEVWKPTFSNMGGIYGIANVPLDDDIEAEVLEQTHAIFLDSGTVSSWPLPNGKQFWVISYASEEPPKRRETDDASISSAAGGHPYKAQLSTGGYSLESTVEILQRYEKLFSPVSGTFGKLIEQSDRIIRVALWDKVWERDEISSNNLVLIGDAARVMNPSSGQGACFAIEDATVLANCLLNFPPTEHPGFSKALEQYTAQRLPRSKSIARQAYWTALVSMGQAWYWRWIRDTVTAWLPKNGDQKRAAELGKKDPMTWLYDVKFKVEKPEGSAKDVQID